MSIIRRDDFVQDTQGRALSGALVYYCTQPATIANPPSPLATVFSSVGGAAGVNPQTTDGYGHCFVYLNNSQLYTVVVIHPLVGILSYTDQNVGSTAAALTPTPVVPAGAINGTNVTFTIPSAPTFMMMLSLNGQIMTQGLGFTFAGTTITMAAAPQVGDTLLAYLF